jgi:hypothetical protein
MERSEIRERQSRLERCSRISLRSIRATDKRIKGSGTPAGAESTSAPYGRGAHPAGCARLPAFHCGACGSEPTPPLSSRTRFLGGDYAGVDKGGKSLFVGLRDRLAAMALAVLAVGGAEAAQAYGLGAMTTRTNPFGNLLSVPPLAVPSARVKAPIRASCGVPLAMMLATTLTPQDWPPNAIAGLDGITPSGTDGAGTGDESFTSQPDRSKAPQIQEASHSQSEHSLTNITTALAVGFPINSLSSSPGLMVLGLSSAIIWEYCSPIKVCWWRLIPSSNPNNKSVHAASITTPRNTASTGSEKIFLASNITPSPTNAPPMMHPVISQKWGQVESSPPLKNWLMYAYIAGALVWIFAGVAAIIRYVCQRWGR